MASVANDIISIADALKEDGMVRFWGNHLHGPTNLSIDTDNKS